MLRNQWAHCLVFSLIAANSPIGRADEPVDFVRDVKPIFVQRCVACHGALKQQGQLRLDTAANALRGGDGGATIIPGKPDSSSLLERITARDEAERMPPEGAPLTAAQIATIRAWIAGGAVAPANEQPEADPRDHWAFRRPQQTALPAGASHPIDALLAAEHQRRGLKPTGPADKSLLLRRVYLDLIGLPPTRDELRAFLADERPDAYERVVDRLLDSPQHGERWARHWMDVWRYSDWYGLGAQLRNSQKHIWHWRDWIIESLNADHGYDRLLREMLAADELTPTDRQTLRATGFLARNYYLFNRTTWLDETIEHSGRAFLGLTTQCIKCHDHKYDPLTQVDYYRLRAIFEPHQIRLDQWPGEVDLEKNGLPRAFDGHPETLTYMHKRGDEKQPDKSRVMTPGIPELFGPDGFDVSEITLPPEAADPALRSFVLDDHLRAAEVALEAARQALSQAERAADKSAPDTARRAVMLAEKTLAAAELRPAMLRAAAAADHAKHVAAESADTIARIREAAVAARKYELAKAEENELRAEAKLASADAKTKPAAEKELTAARNALEQARKAAEAPGEKYSSVRASLKALEGPDETEASRLKPYPRISTGRRAAFARWVTDERNPLTARVAVNHVWLRHFGQALVEPVDDFGRRTPAPALQSLLDWLAVDLREHGWSLKHLHRRIVTSAAYRLTSATAQVDPATLAADPENRFYARRSSVRLESEAIRDSLLHLAGTLDLTRGGPTINPKKEDTSNRRSLYFTQSRDDVHPFLTMFDPADIVQCYRRSSSVVPQQALTLANSRLSLAMARRLAGRLPAESDESFVVAAFEAVLTRAPTPAEAAACLETLAATRELLAKQNKPQSDLRARENLVHALFNHNDFVTVR